GMIFRICEAMGVRELIFTGVTQEKTNRKLLRAARSTIKEIPSRWVLSTQEILAELKDQGYELLGLEITNKSQDIRELGLRKGVKVALLVGAERTGVDEKTLLALDRHTHIPMFGKNLSMNVATALSIALFEIVRQLNA
ncbi:MAG: TrmH family RNA methyltransferase, partial [Saprospiraceae bacterium]|nr:TrmH family RNA methyltransferase [Saprospiraceae bacterium]